ncbi:MAG TPA: FtsX-like permease family protein, partial [Bacilli bacterium]|nr:FtsX-like permease family protein [Bacilli bacterium]
MKLLLKDIFIKIKKSYGRFLSVLFVVSLGVGFFAGLRATSNDMLLTADTYYDKYKLMDYQIISTYGLTDEDVKAIKKLKDVKDAIASYSVDITIDGESVRVHAIEENVNIVRLKSGRMPKSNNECVAENKKYKLNDELNIKNKYLKINKCKVVGLIESALYVGPQKGISSAGNGKLESFIFINKNNFKYDYYTEIYILSNNTKNINSYSDIYTDRMNILKKELESIKEIRETVRYEEVYEKISNEINKNKDKINSEKKINGTKLRNTKKQLDDNNKKLEETEEDLLSSEKTLYIEKEKNEKLIASAKIDLNSGKEAYNNALLSYGLTESTLLTNIESLNTQISNIQKQLDLLTEGTAEYQTLKTQQDILKDQYNKLNTLKNNKEELDSKEKEIISNEQTLKTTFAKNLYKIEKGKADLLTNKDKLDTAYITYYKAYNTYSAKIKEAEEKISDAENDLLTLEKPKWYLLDRNDSIGYSSFEENATKVDAIAKVFPLFFLFVVALIALNTMTRMVEEERGEIGTLAALGYTNKKIIFGYLIYILLATIFGVSFGLITGFNILPRAIYSIYTANYKLPELIIPINAMTFVITTLIAFILMSLVTIYVCYLELKDAPSNLLRPKAPKEGKKVLIEKVNFIWNRLNFSQKVTVRNMFRYKKRIIMTVTGIAGCTALLLTGFGIKDSLTSIVKVQYEEVIKYDISVMYKENKIKMDDAISNNNKIKDSMLVNQELYTFKANDLKNNVYIMTVSDNKDINNFINLKSIVNNKVINVPKEGVIITEKISKLLKL